jgi:ATP-binding cassette subfamily B protein
MKQNFHREQRLLFNSVTNQLQGFKLNIALVLACLLLSKASSFGIPFLLKSIIDDLSLKNNPIESIAFALPISLIVAYGLLNIAHILFKDLKDYLSTKVIQKVISNIGQAIFSHLNALSLHFHVSKRTGELIKDIDRGVRGLQSLTALLLDSFIPTLVEFGFVIVYFAWVYDIWFSVILWSTLITYITYTSIATNRWANARRYINMADSAANQKLLETLLNYETVKYFCREQLEFSQYKKYLEDFCETSINSQKAASVISIGQQIIVSVGLTLVIWLTAIGIANHTMSIGDMVLINSLMLQIYIPLSYFGSFYKQIKQGVIDIEQLFLLLAEKNEDVDSDNQPAIDLSNQNDAPEIKFDSVSFGYSTDKNTLNKISFTVKSGTRTAIVGNTGAGKSTITKLLMRFYSPNNGRIMINDQDISSVSLSSLRQSIGIIPQDISLFNGTIQYNIAYGNPDASFEDVQNAAKLAQLHNFILTLPDQYQTVIGERGLMLSGGERQRLAIARAIIRKPSIFIFDEATSSLDTNTETALQTEMAELFKNRTSIIIAHRLSTISNADQLIVLNNGDIVEIGNHNQLLELQGFYYKMWHNLN